MSLSSSSLEILHRFHPYCARFPSLIVEDAIEKYTKPGDSIFDPFCGSGTTLVASLAKGRKVVGTDIDLLAGMLSEVKCRPLTHRCYVRWRKQFVARLTEAFEEIGRAWKDSLPPRQGMKWSVGALELDVPQFPRLSYWFPPQLTAALATIAKVAHACREPHYERVALISLSASIISKWPNTLSYAMDIDHTRPHRRLQRFTLDHALETYIGRLDRTINCLGKLHEVYKNAGMLDTLDCFARIYYPHDARRMLQTVFDGSQALVITSPPYFNAVDYPRSHRMSVCWMNGYASPELVSRANYIGLRQASGFSSEEWLKSHPQLRRAFPDAVLKDAPLLRRLGAFFADLEGVLREVWRVLKPSGYAVFVIANNVIKGQRVESHRILSKISRAIGFEKIDTSRRTIAGARRRFPVGPFGFDGPMTHEYLVVLRKPPC